MRKLPISIKNDKYRTALSKFRTSSHNLEIERGCHTNPVTPLERRLCLMCQEIEDEIHFTTPHAAKCMELSASTFILKLETSFRIFVHLMIPKNSYS